MSSGRLIEFRCENPRHRDNAAPGVGTITVHERKWAYCDAQENEGHDWKPIAAVQVELLMRVKVSPEELASSVRPTNGTVPAPPRRPQRRAAKGSS